MSEFWEINFVDFKRKAKDRFEFYEGMKIRF